MSSNEKPIDVAHEIANREKNRLEGERDTSVLKSVGGRFIPGSKTFIGLVVIIGFIIGSLMVYKAYQAKKNPASSSSKVSLRNILPSLNTSYQKLMEPVEDVAPASDIPPPEFVKETSSTEPTPQELLRQRRLSSGLMDEEGGQSSSAEAYGNASANLSAEERSDNFSHSSSQEGELQQKMKPLRLEAAMAGQLGNRHYLLTQGSMIDCVLETRMITTQPGMTACYVTRNIYSANGRVILIDRGSKVIGHYQGGMAQGQARIFVLWSRIETPRGVIINIDSPGTGSLGEAGVGGYIDTHFWERFGGAILLSLIDDFSTVATQRMSKSNGQEQMNFSSTMNAAQDMAAEALKNSINIPPTLYKNQGERIAIFVARDLDFRGVYDLQRK